MGYRLFVLGAPSGAGKTTLKNMLLERVPGLRFSISHTTRSPRAGESDGRDYHFVDRASFEAEVKASRFLEWAEVYENLYGTHLRELERARADDAALVLDIDLQGARALRERVPDAAFVLIAPPSWEALEQRLRGRGTDSDEVIERRLALARDQLAGYDVYDFAVVNDDAERACHDLESIIRTERLRIGRGGDAPLQRLLAPS